MSSIYTHQSQNQWKTTLLIVVFLGLVIGFGWLISYYYQDPTILYFAVAFAVVMNVGAYWFSDKLILRMHGAHPVERREYPDLYNILENLTITAGLPMPKLYIIDDPSPNAFATGRDEKHAVVAVTRGLYEMMDRTELEGVLAHELSHIGNKDMLISTIAVVLAGFVTIIADIFIRSHIFGGRNREGGGIIVLIGIAISILAPIFATLLRLAISRKREYLADASAVMLTRNPDGLASALQKLSQNKIPIRKANNATAHLFISNPFSGKRVMRLFATHPPIEDRISRLQSIF